MAKFKKFVALALVAAMSATTVAMAVACGGDGKNPGNSGSETTNKRNDDGKYTYRIATPMLANTWNTHTYKENTSQLYVLDYTEDGLYAFDYNDEKDGYQVVPSMANAMPQDVTSQYVGDTWGIASTDSWKAIRVTLRHDLKYENGDPITAQCFVDSMQLLLNPNAKNYRADSYYDKQFSIAGAKSYAYSERTAYIDASTVFDEYSESIDDQLIFSLWYENDDGANSNFVTSQFEPAGYNFDTFISAFAAGAFGVSASEAKDRVNALNGKTLAEIKADSALKADFDTIFALMGKLVGAEPGQEIYLCLTKKTFDKFDFDGVGVKAVDDYTLDIILEKSLQGFYLKYNLTSALSLVHVPTYKACESTSQGVYTNDYGTSKDKYVGFGPYKISSFTADSEISFARNDYWFGYGDAAYDNKFQTSNISIKQVTDDTQRLEMFLAGSLDSYALRAEDMEDYQSSEWTYYTEGDSTWFIALNPNESGLKSAQDAATPSQGFNSVNKTVLTLKSFRQAMSFSVDREAYELALDPTGSPAKALFGNMIISDPDNGTAYRTTDEAKKVIVDFWGLTDQIGEGKEYATIDEAIAHITGFDPMGAKALFRQAYDEAVAAGMIDTTKNWEVQIVIGQPGSGGSNYYNNGYEFLRKAWLDAVQGTPFENHVTITQSQPLGNSYAEALQANRVDVLFGVGWTGSALDPYSLMEAYVSPDYQYDSGWDTKKEYIDITIPADADATIAGKVLRANLYAWGKDCLQGNAITANIVVNGEMTNETVTISAGTAQVASVRLAILAAVEGAVLKQYDMIPVGTDASASLKGKRIKFYTEEYVYGMGRGGVTYMTYLMTDAEWAQYVSENNGSIDYK